MKAKTSIQHMPINPNCNVLDKISHGLFTTLKLFLNFHLLKSLDNVMCTAQFGALIKSFKS